MPETRQSMRYSDTELELIKATFSDNEVLLKAIRKLMLQMPLSALDLSMLNTTFNGKTETLAVTKKTFLPDLEGDAPIFQVIDLWTHLEIKGKMLEEAMVNIRANERFEKYLRQQFALLEDLDNFEKKSQKPKIKFTDFLDFDQKMDNDILIDLLARNTVLACVEGRIQQLDLLAGRKEETPEEQKKRLTQNSSK